ncbi:DegT/DnrJ/EryC1/StrS family aminotransferase [Actinophytocola sediminis]
MNRADFGSGAEVEAFEARLAAAVDVAHVVGVGSGTAALHLTLAAAGVRAGDEVILPANTFFATAEAVVATGARPVLVDIDPETGNIDPDAVDAAVTQHTSAVIAVHLYGHPADVTSLRRITDRHGLFLLEDASQALAGRWSGKPVGSLGDAGAFSFYPTKNLGALGQAGAVSTSDHDLARRVVALRQHGMTAHNVHDEWGVNERLDGLQAVFLNAKLGHLEIAQRQRETTARHYRRLLAELPDVRLFTIDPHARHAHHLFVVRVPDRDHVRAALDDHGIETGVHYPTPIHGQPAADLVPGQGLPPLGALPNAETHAACVLSLPLYPGIPPDHVDRCVDVLGSVLSAGVERSR